MQLAAAYRPDIKRFRRAGRGDLLLPQCRTAEQISLAPGGQYEATGPTNAHEIFHSSDI